MDETEEVTQLRNERENLIEFAKTCHWSLLSDIDDQIKAVDARLLALGANPYDTDAHERADLWNEGRGA